MTDAESAAALAAGWTDAETEIRAQAVRYVADRDAIEVVTTRHAGFLIPRGWIGALEDVPIEKLEQLEIWPDGSAIALESRDIHISMDGLMAAILPAACRHGPLPPSPAAAVGRFSEAKRSSGQQNGRRGGRPRKAVSAAGAP